MRGRAPLRYLDCFVEHPCHKCGAPVEDGVPFCSQCGAPQIRVMGPESGNTDISPASTLEQALERATPTVPTQASTAAPGAIDWSQGFPVAGMMGLAMGIASLIPVVSIGCCLWMLAGGALSVALYRRRVPADAVPTGMGMRLGAVAGVLGFFSYAVLSALVMAIRHFVFGSGRQMREAMRKVLEQAAASNPDPRAQELIQKMTTPEGIALIVILSLVLFFIAFVLFSALGGALGASLWGQKQTE